MYQVLARKYRPRNFNELVGQNHVSRALTSALERGRLHHAYLFTGTRGVGKTTIARILAKCLNCETGVTSTPCEVCPTCKAVNEGRFIDLIEIDAASRTKVEDTRELLDNVPYAPTQGRFKVYLIDEVHMLSTHSFNALLKTLEEPPEHVKFLFATTDPQKLPITVISRCLQFTLRPLAVDEITVHLTDVLQKEQIQAEQDAIWQIAESAQGSVRDALSLTDQAIAYGQGAIQHQDVKDMLGLIDRTIIYDLIAAIHQNQKQRVSELLMQFRQQALDVSLVLDQLISTLHELALLQYLPDLSLKYSAEINKKIMQLSQMISAQDLQLYYQVSCKGRADLQLAVTQEQGFEMCVLRLLAFRPLQPNEVLVSATPQVQQQVPQVDVQAAVHNVQQHVVDEHVAEESVLETPAMATQPNIEPSSDDFLDEPILDSVETNVTPVMSATNSDQMIFDPASEDALFDLDESNDEVNVVADDEPNSDDFLFDEIA
ncbi:MAG: DNA polymerase III subunit gamma/tau, partial [Acinetobacter bohemicus]